MPQVGTIWESYKANEFVLEIEGIESPGVSKVTGLSQGEMDTIEQPDGGSNHRFKIATGVIKFDPLTIERYVDGSDQDKIFQDWFKETFNLTTNPTSFSAVRKNGAVVKKYQGKEVLRFTFHNAWVKSSKFTDLEAGTNNLMKQTVVLEHEGLELFETKPAS